jgi:hypothetical protein
MDCDVCLIDPDVRYEVKKITAIVLPPSKMTKQPKQEEAEEEVTPPEPDNGDPDSGGEAEESVGVDPKFLEKDDVD